MLTADQPATNADPQKSRGFAHIAWRIDDNRRTCAAQEEQKMWLQVDGRGNPMCCKACGNYLRSSPIYDGWPHCKRKRCIAKRLASETEATS